MKDSDQKSKIITQINQIYDHFSSKQISAKLIPEVRTNISGIIKDAENTKDVAGIDGRITIVDGFPKACGEIKFGASNHTARLIFTANQHDPNVNFVMNLKYLPNLIKTLQDENNLKLHEFKRGSQPTEILSRENSTMQWLIRESIDHCSSVPDIIWDKGAVGKEPIMRLFAKNAEEMIGKLDLIIGKLD